MRRKKVKMRMIVARRGKQAFSNFFSNMGLTQVL